MSGLTRMLRRLGMTVLVIICVSMITFMATRFLPADPAALYAGPRASADKIAEVRSQLGLDKPVALQYFSFAGDALRGDFGISFRTRQPISADIKRFLPATLELVFSAMALAIIIGIPLGVVAALHPGGVVDQLTRLLAISMASIPSFWVAMILQLIFFKWLDWLPLSGQVSTETMLFNPIEPITGMGTLDALLGRNWVGFRDACLHLILPALTLSLYPIGLTLRMTRSSMGVVMKERYITTARAMGISTTQILFKFALKNALAPVLTVLGLTFAFSLTGAVLVEVIFDWPGIGAYVTAAILAVDFPVIMAVTLVGTIVYIVVNLLVDMTQAMLDPRVTAS